MSTPVATTGLTEESLDGFATTFRREIVFHLRQLINSGEPISVIFNEGRDSILTVLIAVNESKDMLIFDWGSSETVNRRFLDSERNFFVATPNGIRNQFPVGQPWKVTYQKRPAFAVNLPKKYVRLQRREYFRLVLPVTQRPKCMLTLGEGPKVEAAVLDLGLGGMALELSDAGTPAIENDMVFAANVELKDFGALKADVRVRYTAQVTRGIKKLLRIGCRFDHLSPAQELQLQKYSTQIQHNENSHLRG